MSNILMIKVRDILVEFPSWTAPNKTDNDDDDQKESMGDKVTSIRYRGHPHDENVRLAGGSKGEN